jgi:hypothetical protein
VLGRRAAAGCPSLQIESEAVEGLEARSPLNRSIASQGDKVGDSEKVRRLRREWAPGPNPIPVDDFWLKQKSGRTAMKKLRIVILRFGTAGQKMVLE